MLLCLPFLSLRDETCMLFFVLPLPRGLMAHTNGTNVKCELIVVLLGSIKNGSRSELSCCHKYNRKFRFFYLFFVAALAVLEVGHLACLY